MTIELIIIAFLIAIILFLMIERFFFARQMLAQVSDALKASMSRNINEYMVATTPRNSTTAVAQMESDEVELSQATDEQFEKYIQNKDNIT